MPRLRSALHPPPDIAGGGRLHIGIKVGAAPRMHTDVDLNEGAHFIGVATMCSGDCPSDEPFDRSRLNLATTFASIDASCGASAA